jgi:hypothetical protein
MFDLGGYPFGSPLALGRRLPPCSTSRSDETSLESEHPWSVCTSNLALQGQGAAFAAGGRAHLCNFAYVDEQSCAMKYLLTNDCRIAP